MRVDGSEVLLPIADDKRKYRNELTVPSALRRASGCSAQGWEEEGDLMTTREDAAAPAPAGGQGSGSSPDERDTGQEASGLSFSPTPRCRIKRASIKRADLAAH